MGGIDIGFLKYELLWTIHNGRSLYLCLSILGNTVFFKSYIFHGTRSTVVFVLANANHKSAWGPANKKGLNKPLVKMWVLCSIHISTYLISSSC